MSATTDTWPSFIANLSETAPDDLQTDCTSEEQFRVSFESVCEQNFEPDPQRLLGRFVRQHVAIITFTGMIDAAQGLQSPDSLSDLFWRIAFGTIQAALESEISPQELFEPLSHLNKGFKPFGPQLPQFPADSRVQEPLQAAFKEYIDCYSTMLSQFASHPTGIDFGAFALRADAASSVFEKQLADWKDILRNVAEEKEKLREASLPSFPNGVLGHPNHPMGTSARFQWLKTLGQGTYAQVSSIREVATKSIYAQKTIRVPNNSSARNVLEMQVKNEVEIMQKLRHHHIASVLFYTKDESAFYIVMLPVADYDLRHYLEENCVQAGFPRAETRRLDAWFGCLASALTYAHQEEVKHEDIKPSNILIRKNQPYLADFGSAIDFSDSDKSTSAEEFITGTPVYWPPEPRGQRGRKADVFALGCVFSDMLTVRQNRSLGEYRDARFMPHVDNGYAFRTNLEAVYGWLQDLPENGNESSEVRTLLIEQTISMLAKDPGDRPEAARLKRNLRQEADTLFCLTCG